MFLFIVALILGIAWLAFPFWMASHFKEVEGILREANRGQGESKELLKKIDGRLKEQIDLAKAAAARDVQRHAAAIEEPPYRI